MMIDNFVLSIRQVQRTCVTFFKKENIWFLPTLSESHKSFSLEIQIHGRIKLDFYFSLFKKVALVDKILFLSCFVSARKQYKKFSLLNRKYLYVILNATLLLMKLLTRSSMLMNQVTYFFAVLWPVL